jgi:hypothetical protein
VSHDVFKEKREPKRLIQVLVVFGRICQSSRDLDRWMDECGSPQNFVQYIGTDGPFSASAGWRGSRRGSIIPWKDSTLVRDESPELHMLRYCIIDSFSSPLDRESKMFHGEGQHSVSESQSAHAFGLCKNHQELIYLH